jgi:hypothetical protein
MLSRIKNARMAEIKQTEESVNSIYHSPWHDFSSKKSDHALNQIINQHSKVNKTEPKRLTVEPVK